MTPSTRYPEHLERWREAARIAAGARELGVRLAVPGATRRELAEAIEGYIRDAGAAPAFPANLSRNAEAAHYTPDAADPSRLEAGDLLKVDVGAHLDGAVADTADTVEVGGLRQRAHLIGAVHDALAAGVRAVRPGGAVDEVSRAVARAIRARGLEPVRDLTGHSGGDRPGLRGGHGPPTSAARAGGRLLIDSGRGNLPRGKRRTSARTSDGSRGGVTRRSRHRARSGTATGPLGPPGAKPGAGT